ncbi:MAG: septum formation initiator family protein [Nitrospira sp.]|nr:septum formation initiator family protein [Nitrospira sp.]
MLIKRNRGPQWLTRRKRLAVVLQAAGVAACLWLLVGLVFGEMGLLRYFAMREYARRLESELATLGAEKAALEKEVMRLQRDPAKIEQVARERLGYVREGEIVYQLIPPAAEREQGKQP